jgi:hypothetical protein
MVLFSQAPADIQYVLSLYDKYKNKYKILIVVVNVKNNYKYFESLNLGVRVDFIPLVGQNKKLEFLKYVFKLRTIYSVLFKNISDAEVYFFSKNYDYVTAFFIEKLMKNNTIYFYDIYKIDGEELGGYKYTLKKLIIKFLFGINIKFFSLPPSIAYQYKFDNKNVHQISSVNSAKLYKYRIKKINNKKNLLLFESNGEQSEDFLNYKENMMTILNELKDRYNIYIKPHPRLGYSQILNKYKVNVIPDYIPGELVDTKDFDIVLGIDSSSIAIIKHHNKYSLINLFEFKDDTRKQYLKEYLDNLSIKNILYIKNIKSIK